MNTSWLQNSINIKDIKKSFFVVLFSSIIFAVYTHQLLVGILLLCLVWPLSIVFSLSLSKSKKPPKKPGRSPKLDVVWCGTLIGLATTLNYLWFFERHSMSMDTAIIGTQLHIKGLFLAFFTMFLCICIYILQHRYKDGILSKHFVKKRSIWLKSLALVAFVAICIYWPLIIGYQYVDALGAYDWLSIILVSMVFMSIREFQRWDQQHNRHSVYDLHITLKQK